MRARLLDGALDPVNLVDVDAEVILQMATNPHGSRLRIEPDADLLAFEILRRADARIPVDEDEAMAKGPRGKHRHADEAILARIHHADEL